MTDDGSAEPAPTPAPVPEAPAVVVMPEVPTVPMELKIPPVVPPEAVKDISAEITEAVKDAVMENPEPVAPVSSPAPIETDSHKNSIVSYRDVALAARRAERHKNKEKIFELKDKKRVISNNDVELLLKVSDRTAGTFLRELAAEGKIQKIGGGSRTRYCFP